MIPVAETRVAGLDEILGGGIPLRTMLLVLGTPGAGKTILAEQVAVQQAKQGKRVLIFTALSESHEQLLTALREFTFFDEALIGDRIRFLSIQTILQDGLEATADAIVEMARTQEASVVVLDGFRGVAGFASSGHDVRLFLYAVRTRLALLDVTSIVTLETSLDQESDTDVLTIADGIVRLHNTLWGVRHRRHIEVQKLRAMRHLNGLHAMAITTDGIRCYARHEAVYRTTNYGVGPDRVAFGMPELDAMLRGGLNQGTATFLAGTPGVGKTLTALRYIMTGADMGEPGLFIALIESAGQLYDKAANFGMDLRGAVERGIVTLLSLPPVEMEVDVFAAMVRERVERHGIQRLVIDSAAAVEEAIIEPHRAASFFTSLLNYLREHGVTSVLTQERVSRSVFRDGDVLTTIIPDNTLLMRVVEYHNDRRRILSIAKMRQSDFDPGLREVRIADGTIRVLPANESDLGVLMGIATQENREMHAIHTDGSA